MNKNNEVIAVVNHKGGVGKTTITMNFGACLAAAGYRVLLVDLDQQGSLTRSCGITVPDDLEETIADSFLDVMNEEEEIRRPLMQYRDNIYLFPANMMLSKVNILLVNAMTREQILKRILEPVRHNFDYILIDCAPSVAQDTINAFTAADKVLIVSGAESFSMLATKQLADTFVQTKRSLNPSLSLAGILFNRVDKRKNFSKDIIHVMRQSWGSNIRIFETEISESIRVAESQAASMPLIEYEPENKVAQDLTAFTREFLSGGKQWQNQTVHQK